MFEDRKEPQVRIRCSFAY